MLLSREALNVFLVALTIFVVLTNLDKVYDYFMGSVYIMLFEIDFWTYFLIASGIAFVLFKLIRKYKRNQKAIKKLSYVNHITMDEYEARTKETTKKALAELARNPKYLDLKARLERERRDGLKVASPPLTEDEDDFSISGDD